MAVMLRIKLILVNDYFKFNLPPFKKYSYHENFTPLP